MLLYDIGTKHVLFDAIYFGVPDVYDTFTIFNGFFYFSLRMACDSIRH